MIQEMKQPFVNQSARFQRSVTYSESPWVSVSGEMHNNYLTLEELIQTEYK